MAPTWRDRVRISRGDLTEATTDAIVNAANNDLQLGGGPAIQDECDKIGSIPLGEAAITGGGNLCARYVIHAASMHLGGRTSEENLRASTRNSLLRAGEKGLHSISFPAIGTGIAGFPMKRCAEVMLDEVRTHLSGATTVESVEFILFDTAALDTFQQVLNSLR
jgi:O-acetyl-ADP-ribose deacetylase (regulator of RNase III)